MSGCLRFPLYNEDRVVDCLNESDAGLIDVEPYR